MPAADHVDSDSVRHSVPGSAADLPDFLPEFPRFRHGDASMIEPCNRRGEETWPGFFRCNSNRIMHPEPGIVAIATCGICPSRNMPDREGAPEQRPDPRFTTPCAHRGEVLERSTCTACGMRG